MDVLFNIVMIAEISASKINLVELQKTLKEKGKEINVDIKAQHEDIFNVMHNV